MQKKKIVCHVVSHTHWDRAWYIPFELFRMRLVDMMDHLLETLKNPEFRYFVFDGQMVPLEDYLEIKPEKRKVLRDFIQKGKLVIGPAYVLPDEYLISAETHVRNLLIGHKAASQFGPVQKVGYYPDEFGHVSQIPQIMNGFGIDSFVFSRGMGDEGEKLGPEFRWEAPHGNGSVLACHQLGGYGNARMLGVPYCEYEIYPANFQDALKYVEDLVDFHLKSTDSDVLLLNNGVDHHHAQERIPQVIDYINAKSPKLHLIHSTFQGFVNEVLKARSKLLKTYKGELYSGRYHWILSGTLSARMYLKQANFQCSSILERGIEPLASLAWLLGANYPYQYLDYAWKTLMKNHPHDDICGCSVDAVHQDMMNRFAHVEQVSQGLQKRLIDHILSAVKFKDEEWGIPLLVLNTRPAERSSEAHVEAVIPRERFKGKKILLVDGKGNIQSARIKLLDTFKHPGFWGDREMQRVSVSFHAKDIPSLGYKAFYLKEAAPKLYANPASPVSVTKDSLENKQLKVKINDNGTLDVLHKKTGLHLKGIHYFEDCADAGDEYDFSHILKDTPITTKSLKAKIKTEVIGGYKAIAHISLLWPLPVSLAKDRKNRSPRKTKTRISCEIGILAGERRIEFKTTIDNQIMDHRLRAIFPTTLKAEKISVESKFDVIDRPFTFTAKAAWAQAPLNTRHQEHFASLSDGKKGVSFLIKGLPEYEVQPAKKGANYHLTLLRSVGWLSRGDLLTRNANAGPSFETPEAQCLGKHTFEYAMILHEGNWEKANIQREAYDYATPVVSASHYHHVRDWKGASRVPDEAGFVRLNPDDLILTALKKAEERDSLILRFYNPGTKEIEGYLDFGFDITEANQLRLDETPLKKMKIEDNHLVFFSINPKQIMTVEAVWN